MIFVHFDSVQRKNQTPFKCLLSTSRIVFVSALQVYLWNEQKHIRIVLIYGISWGNLDIIFSLISSEKVLFTYLSESLKVYFFLNYLGDTSIQ